MNYYSKSIATVASSANAEAVHFLFSKGKKNKEAGNRFYMVYLSSYMDLRMVQKMNSSMMSVVQTEDGELSTLSTESTFHLGKRRPMKRRRRKSTDTFKAALKVCLKSRDGF